MARKGKYEEWLQPENLTKITNWAAKGFTDREICKNIGIHHKTFYEWVDRFGAFSAALKSGRELALESIENSFFENAFGKTEETIEIIEEEQEFINGRWIAKKRHVRKTTKKLPPNVTAQIFYLKNKGGYRDNPEQSIEIEDTDAYLENFEL